MGVEGGSEGFAVAVTALLVAWVAIVCRMSYCCFADRAVERPCYQATPGEDDESDEGNCGADADENCAFWQVGLLHKGCIGGRRYARWWVGVPS